MVIFTAGNMTLTKESELMFSLSEPIICYLCSIRMRDINYSCAVYLLAPGQYTHNAPLVIHHLHRFSHMHPLHTYAWHEHLYKSYIMRRHCNNARLSFGATHALTVYRGQRHVFSQLSYAASNSLCVQSETGPCS